MSNGNVDALSVAQDFASLSGVVANILGDDNLDLSDDDVNNLNEYNRQLVTYSDNTAIQVALNALSATQANLDAIKRATSAANAAAARMQADATRLNSVLTIIGDAVTLGAAIISGPLTGVLTAATTLGAAAGGN
jgi:hypothetical protein